MKNILLFVLLVFSNVSYSQVEVKAKLISSSGEAIQYASVLILETFEGTITDSLGFFSINVVDNNQTLIFQCLGFKTDTFLVKDLSSIQEVKLEIEDFNLREVIVKPKNAFDIMRKAVAKIPDNYYSKTIAQNVFYRQEIIANNKMLNIEEANFDALVKYKNKNVNIVTINKARAIIDMESLKSLGKLVEKQIEGFDSVNIRDNASQFFGVNFMLQDEIGDESKDIFGKKGYLHYDYSYNGLVKKDTFYAYHITFDQVDKIKKSLMKGHLYIDTASLAFIDIQVYLSPKGIAYQKVIPKSVILIAKVLGYTIYIKGFHQNVHYQRIDGKWVLDNADFKLSARVSKKNGGDFDGYLKTMFHVNKFYLKEGFYNKKSAYDKIDSDVEDFKNENFWENLKFIPLSIYENKLINIKTNK